MTGVRDRLDQQAAHERRRATRALLTSPLRHVERDVDDFRLVRRHADALRRWFADEAGWTLTVDSTTARLRKLAPTLDDGTRPARARRGDPPFSRRRYALLCLALASLETADRQVALGRLAEGILGSVAADPTLQDAGITFDLDRRDQRRDLVAVVRLLLHLGVLRLVDGRDSDFVAGTGDALYTIDRSALAAMPNVRRAPSAVTADDLDTRMAAVTAEVAPSGDAARNRAIRTHLVRRLLDDAVVYYADLAPDELAYLTSQRHRLVTSVADATGLVPEIRAEGIAMVDDRGDATDLEVPDQGTDGHLTLLVAEYLAQRLRDQPTPTTTSTGPDTPATPVATVTTAELQGFVADCIAKHASHWRRDVCEPGAEVHLAGEVAQRLAAIGLVRVVDDGVVPRPAIARYAVAEPSLPDAPNLFAT